MDFDKENSRVLVTGASGFVGQHLCASLAKLQIDFIPTLRSSTTQFSSQMQVVVDINESTDWSYALSDVSCVIHLAARVHEMQDLTPNALIEYRRVNVEVTMNLARQAARYGAKRFVYMSSAKVNGEFTDSKLSFSPDDCPRPQDPYSISKYEAEIALIELSKKTEMEIVIVRPPLVYGPGVKANFLSMMYWLNKSVPLPFGNIINKRSLVFVDNLVDLLVKVIDHPKAAGQVFLVSDDQDVSTTKLLHSLSMALGKKVLLIKVPMCFLNITLRLVGKSGLSQRLLSSLQLDITKTKKLLDWTPPVSFEEGIKKTAAAYLEDLK